MSELLRPCHRAKGREKMKTIKFTDAEIRHLQSVMSDNLHDGTHYGNYDHWIKRADKINRKLDGAFNSDWAYTPHSVIHKHMRKDEK